MNRIRKLVTPSASYEPLLDNNEANAGDVDDRSIAEDGESRLESRFSLLEYSIFFLLGIAMLWAWNMFLAAAPYFHHRFDSSEWAVKHYQPSILSVSTVTNLASATTLAKLQKNASYSKRITLSLMINIVVFSLLAFSTVLSKGVSVGVYFAFVLVMVFGASLATGVNQNGVFSYVSGFGRGEYTQAIMAGQGVAGVLPCIVQIIAVLAVPEQKDGVRQESSKSAFAYFATSTAVSALALASFFYLERRQSRAVSKVLDEADDETVSDNADRKTIGLWTLFKKLRWMALALFLCFAVTMVFPVFTAEIESVRDPSDRPRLLQQATFIPLAFLLWNTGDLIGRVSVLIPQIPLVRYPKVLFSLAISRLVFIPLYMLCNVRGRGAAVNSDAFYLFFVQLLFGITNGYIASSCMVGAAQWVAVEERHAAGGFMSLMLVAGLTVGSLLSFLVANA
ncbi:hypothetical protein VTN00DRAFT_7686 [Thermoascus crustaceus]|uniref:uncharacterized protein n=1 Tax=Thermoascus crustaceus TaxID=5088 RepID=UPI00374201EB